MPEDHGLLPAHVVAHLEAKADQYDRLGREMEEAGAAGDHRRAHEMSRQRAALEPLVLAYRRYRRACTEADSLRTLAGQERDADMAALAREELAAAERRAADEARRIRTVLLSADEHPVGSVILEIRAGTGGAEAALWARDLLEMYQRYAAARGWSFEIMDFTPDPDVGGIRSAVAGVRGEGVWTELAHEAGVHCVKRVPATETQGRIHTSTATVAVLPEPEEVDVVVDWSRDVDEHVTTSQGPGGQNVNKVATAVQLIHKPTGIVIRMQEAKSQHQNRERARRLLLARLNEMERRRQHEARVAARREQIGAAERSQRIRTYRFRDNIVVDERLPGEYPLKPILAGDLGPLIRALVEQAAARRLAEL